MKKIIGHIYPVTETLALLIERYWRKVSLPAQSLLLTAGEVNTKLYFIEKGVARVHYERQSQEYTSGFAQEGDFLYSVGSYLTQTPSLESLQLIEDSKLWFIDYAAWQDILTAHPEANYIVRVLTEKSLLLSDTRIRIFRGTTPKERLNLFIQTYPDIYTRVPLKYIASYLDISPSTLSRVRSELMREDRTK